MNLCLKYKSKVINYDRLAQLNSGVSPVEDVSSKELAAAVASGRYSVTGDFAAISNSAVVVICVPTPLDGNREPDLTLLESAVKSIARDDGCLFLDRGADVNLPSRVRGDIG